MSWNKSSILSAMGGPVGAAIWIFSGLFGVLFGVAVFTFGYANGFAYFGHDPATCNSCHAMNEQYNAWKTGSHKNVAGCGDCHAPHDNIVHYYWNKADNGFWHSLKFTTQNYPENIQIREVNRKITQAACLHCHEEMVADIEMTRLGTDKTVDCLHCHSDVGHKR